MSDQQFEAEVKHETNAIKSLLIQKNEAYGNSALDPVRIFAPDDLPASTMLRVRIDDKLSRLSRGHEGGEDVTRDLLGYLILLRIAERRERHDELLRTEEAHQDGTWKDDPDRYGADQDGTYPAKALLATVLETMPPAARALVTRVELGD